jgi:AcrR family transcriptional regulator
MNSEQRILFAAKHAFLKLGYYGSTLDHIAKLAGTSRTMIHYYYKSKNELFRQAFSIYIKYLHEKLDTNTTLKSHPIDQGIEYPTLHDIAWFISNEFRSNSNLTIKIINEDPELKSIFIKSFQDKAWIEKFRNLITAELEEIFIKNHLRSS